MLTVWGVMLKKHVYFFILFVLLLNGCNPAPQPVHQEKFYVFGTLVGVTFWDAPPEKVQAASQMLQQTLQTMHTQWHAWQPSQLTTLNQAIAQGQALDEPDAQLVDMLQQAKHFSLQSDDLFNPAIGKLVALWGFHNDEFTTQKPPEEEKVIALLAEKPSMQDLVITPHQISANNPNIQLDLGGFAKGYALDTVIAELQNMGIQNAIVNMGGNLKAIGQRNHQPWNIGIRHPRPTEDQSILAAVAIQDEESVVTSGDYERYYEYNGQRYFHILNPRTGHSPTQFVSVTVIDKSAALADAASTALMVAGINDWHRVAKQMNIKYALLVDTDGVVHVNPLMGKRVQFRPKQKPPIFISEPLIDTTQ